MLLARSVALAARLPLQVEKEWMAYGHKFSERCAHSHPPNGKPSEEQSQVFVLWLDCVWQVLRQFPTILEFNEAFLLALGDQLFSCRFGKTALARVRSRVRALPLLSSRVCMCERLHV